MTVNRYLSVMSMFILSIGLITCDSIDNVGCTLDVRSLTIEVVDEQGNPVSGMDLEIINQRTGRALCEEIENDQKRSECEKGKGGESLGVPGRYSIVSTRNTVELGDFRDVKHQDRLEVTGKLDGQVLFTQEYTMVMDEYNCHPERLIGPLKIVVELPEGE